MNVNTKIHIQCCSAVLLPVPLCSAVCPAVFLTGVDCGLKAYPDVISSAQWRRRSCEWCDNSVMLWTITRRRRYQQRRCRRRRCRVNVQVETMTMSTMWRPCHGERRQQPWRHVDDNDVVTTTLSCRSSSSCQCYNIVTTTTTSMMSLSQRQRCRNVCTVVPVPVYPPLSPPPRPGVCPCLF